MLQSPTRYASHLSITPLKEGDSTPDVSTRDLYLHPGDPFPSVYSLRTQFSNLWRISMVGLTGVPDKSFQSLSCFVGLGLLDVSFTNISLKVLQSYLRPIQILALNTFGCQNLESVPRSFLVYTLPNTWSLNGLIPTCIQRAQYKQIYTTGKGRFSETYRKHFIDFDPKLIPTRLWPTLEPTDQKKNLKEIQVGCLWSPQSKLLASNVPQHFTMGFEQDIWRARRLAFDLESDLAEMLQVSETEIQAMRNAIDSIMAPPSTGSDSNLNSTYSRACLLLFLLASLTSGLDPRLLQSALETVFSQSKENESIWTYLHVSPLFWPLNQRLFYAAMLLARLSIRSPTESDSQQSKLLFTPERLKVTEQVIFLLKQQSYLSSRPKTASSHQTAGTFPKIQLNSNESQCLSLLSLETIRPCCVIPDTSFLKSFLPHLCEVIQTQIKILFPNPKDQEEISKNLDIYDSYPHQLLSFDGSQMSTEAQGLEIRFRLLSSLEQIRETWNAHQLQLLNDVEEDWT